MRRLILEVSREEMSKAKKHDILPEIKSLEILHFLRQDSAELSAICKVVIDTQADIKLTLSNDNNIEAQILEQEKLGVFTIFIKSKIDHSTSENGFLGDGGAYLAGPFEMTPDKIRITCIGEDEQIKRTLALIRNMEIHYKIISLTDAKFSPHSPLNDLTDKQRAALITAFNLGYYDVPRRKVSSVQLAKKLNIHSSALIAHRRKAEFRLLSQLLRE